MPPTLARLALRAALLALAGLLALYLWYFADHARQLLAYPYPLDYGEGPLLAQVERLRAGVPIWQLYADPAQPPYLIVNYPPLYLLLSAWLAGITGSALVAGRLIALLSALGCVAALALLARAEPPTAQRRSMTADIPPPMRPTSWVLRPASLLALLFLTLPIVREWAALMRVDLLGICLGLWGLVLLQAARGGRQAPGGSGQEAWAGGLRAGAAGTLLLGCLFVKPSLIAAPVAGGVWLAWQAWRAPQGARRPALVALAALAAPVGIGGGLLFALLQSASGGWFALHVVAANANRWEAGLAWGFWAQQLALRWPLALAALLAAGALWRARPGALWLPLLYSAGGVVAALGVGKVGAYSNYFLELYAGLVWLVTASAQARTTPAEPALAAREARRGRREAEALVAGTMLARGAPPASFILHLASRILLIAALLYYPPLWDEGRLRPAGLLEPSPPRLAFGRYGLWADAAREADLLSALGRVNAALLPELRAAGPQLFTDMPGVAAAAGVASRLQAFEARQLFDQGLADQDQLLIALAHGEPPLAVLDYLGNWLTPAMVELLQRRYAQDGSLGTFDLFRAVDPGPPQPLATPRDSAVGVRLLGYRLAAPVGAAYEPGELLTLALEWQRSPALAPGRSPTPEVYVELRDAGGALRAANRRALLYGALPPERWPAGATLQHMQPLALPPDLAPGAYRLAVGLGAEPARPIASIAVADQGGRSFAETGHFVPGQLLRAWSRLGAVERAGYPLTPAVPFAWGRLQCFERVCLELRGATARLRPLGELLYLAETIRGAGCGGQPDAGPTSQPDALCPGFRSALAQYGQAGLGPAISGELERSGWLVQWTRDARLERPPGDGAVGLGRLGDDALRLPPGMPYRWP